MKGLRLRELKWGPLPSKWQKQGVKPSLSDSTLPSPPRRLLTHMLSITLLSWPSSKIPLCPASRPLPASLTQQWATFLHMWASARLRHLLVLSSVCMATAKPLAFQFRHLCSSVLSLGLLRTVPLPTLMNRKSGGAVQAGWVQREGKTRLHPEVAASLGAGPGSRHNWRVVTDVRPLKTI